MTIKVFLSNYYLHDSLVKTVVHEKNTVKVTIDFCFWMQGGYQEGYPETGIIDLIFPDVSLFYGPTGTIDDYSILEADYQDSCLTLLLMDDYNNNTYELRITSTSGIVEIKR